MLNTLIKRDGSLEPFTPHKVNNWAQWATTGIKNRVDWSRVVMESVKAMGEISSSQDLQKQLIKKLLEQRTWPYNLMAGRLYSVLIRKEFYGNSIPTVKELQETLFNAGLVRKLDYSDEDYQVITGKDKGGWIYKKDCKAMKDFTTKN